VCSNEAYLHVSCFSCTIAHSRGQQAIQADVNRLVSEHGTLEEAELALTGGFPPDIFFVLDLGLSDIGGNVSTNESTYSCSCRCCCGCYRMFVFVWNACGSVFKYGLEHAVYDSVMIASGLAEP
jgi:hypothetical protein